MKRFIVIALVFISASLYAQNTTVVPFNGVVTDALDKPLKNVRIYVVDPSFYARSDKRGRFGLTNVLPTDTLHVIYNKERYDIPVGNRRSIRIKLGNQLSAEWAEDRDLVDLGIGYIKRREQANASNGISGEVIKRTGKSNLLDAIQGMVPGLIVRIDPSTGKHIAQIRGAASVQGNLEPLYLIDGAETDTFEFLNLNEIESVEIIKDANIYGVRGANGVISVRTKRH